MDKRHKTAIQRIYAKLGQELYVDETFLMHFRPDNVLNENMMDEILAKPTKAARATEFLNTIMRRGPRAFPRFIYALMECGQSHVADWIDPNGELHQVGSEVSTMPSSHPYHPALPYNPAGGDYYPPVPVNVPTQTNSIMDLNIRPMPVEFIRRLQSDPNVYPFKQPRGRAIILSNEIFEKTCNLSNREGSAFDVLNMDQLLTKLGYKTESWANLTSTQILERLDFERNHKEHSSADSFIFVCMSHGNRGNIFGKDGVEVSIEEKIVASFDARNCPGLMNKPKLFFIQACQGDLKTKGIVHDGVEDPLPEHLQKALDRLSLTDEHDARTFQTQKVVPANPAPTAASGAYHEKADTLILYATVPGYKAWRNTEQGSWFIRDLIQTICDHSAHDDISHIATKVGRKISDRAASSSGYKQISKLDSTLIKNFYFVPPS